MKIKENINCEGEWNTCKDLQIKSNKTSWCSDCLFESICPIP